MADSYKQVGIDYCLTHHGTRNEDDPVGRCNWWRRADDHADDDLPCRLVPLAYEPPKPPPGPTMAQRMDALLYAMFNSPSEADIDAMKKALAYYDRQVEMGAVPSPFAGDGARNIVAYALGMLGEYKPATDGDSAPGRDTARDGSKSADSGRKDHS